MLNQMNESEQSVRSMQEQLDPLISLISVRGRNRMLRREFARRDRSNSAAEIEKECIDSLIDWLAYTLLFSEPTDSESVREFAQSQCLVRVIVEIERLVTQWTQTPPEHDRFNCLQTLVDLLEIVACKKDMKRGEIQSELIASYFLVAALWNQTRALPLIGGVTDQPFTKSDLRELLRGKTQLAEIVRIVRKERGLAASQVE